MSAPPTAAVTPVIPAASAALTSLGSAADGPSNVMPMPP